jgi:hypothetical protein
MIRWRVTNVIKGFSRVRFFQHEKSGDTPLMLPAPAARHVPAETGFKLRVAPPSSQQSKGYASVNFDWTPLLCDESLKQMFSAFGAFYHFGHVLCVVRPFISIFSLIAATLVVRGSFARILIKAPSEA